MRRRLADERGQASAELMGMMAWLMLVTLIVWQVALAAWTYTQVSNAARTASRVEARGGDPKKAVRNALSAPLRKNLETVDDQRREGHREGAHAARAAGHLQLEGPPREPHRGAPG